ncbi:MAG: F0F1 ATP synthase subunit B' [Rhodospirillaceae bacterium]|nr:F0F1 ATP synthase subunit B' [Rhodospirillaceae bacterium]
MPQFDPSVFSPQLFWLLVSFIALYWLVAKVAVPRVGEVLEQRARVIQEDLDRATQLKAETDAAAAAYEKAMADARHQAQDHMRAMQADVKAVSEKRTADITGQIGKQVSEAEARIASAKQAALDAMKGIAADTARDVVAKLASVTPDAGAVDAAVAAALKETR